MSELLVIALLIVCAGAVGASNLLLRRRLRLHVNLAEQIEAKLAANCKERSSFLKLAQERLGEIEELAFGDRK